MHARRTGIKLMGRFHTAIYRLSGGRLLARVANMPVLLLTTTGRRTGSPRTVPLTYLEHGDDLVVIGSNGGERRPPQWWLNLQADPHAVVTIARRARPVVARETTPAERDELWPRVVGTNPGYAGYASRTTRRIPVVLLTPADRDR
jgi:deazaflavin-dependent oxidoreductase (nitroreductase family)